MREDVRAVLNLPAGMADAMLATASELVQRLPGMLGVLERGLCSDRHARLLAEATMRLDDEHARQVQDTVLAKAPGSTLAAFGRSVARAVLEVDPADAEERHREAAAERKVSSCPRPDGMTGLWALLPAWPARSAPAPAGSPVPRWQGMRPGVDVTVALSTLLGLDDQPRLPDGATRWTSPSGHQITVRPRSYPIDRTAVASEPPPPRPAPATDPPPF